MSKFSMFMKQNKKPRENGKWAVTKSLCDANGNPLEWEFRHISSKENEEIREECTMDVPVPGKPNMYRQKIKSGRYVQELIARSVVYPDLFNPELQDSYGVVNERDLLMAMVDDPGEYAELAAHVQEFQGFVSLDEKVDEAKN